MPLPLRRRPAAPVGVVLAGGRGRRLGGAKAAVELLGRALVVRAADVLVNAGLRDVAVLAKADTGLPPLPAGVARWDEPDEPFHPLAGLVHGLHRAAGRPVVALACDLPLVPVALVRLVAAEPPRGTRATVVRGQPLCGRYEPAALAPLEAALLGRRGARVTEAVAALRPREVEPLGVDDLHNVNTPEDLLAAAALLDRRAGRGGAA